MIYDIHSHRKAPYPQGVISPEIKDFRESEKDGGSPAPSTRFPQLYSIGLHPWHSGDADADAILERVALLAALPCVAAVGECGIDLVRPGCAPLYEQMLQLRRQADIAETMGKPLVLHAVKSQEMIIGMRGDMAATRHWCVHGFRAKPSVAQMYLKAGIWLSYGELFNADSLRATPPEMLLAETDDSLLSIEEIMRRQAEVAGMPAKRYFALIAANTARFLGISAVPQ